MNKAKRATARLKKIFKRRPYLAIIAGFLLLFLFYFFILKDLPSPTRLGSSQNQQSSQILDRRGELLYTVYANKNRTQIPLSQIPKDLQEATIAIEDRDFYKHGAIDFRGIARSIYSIVIRKELQGGSTLTQQLVKNSLLTQERTIQRKLKEIPLAFVTEALYSKSQILEMYLNQIPYGGTAYGIEAASQTYFGKHAKDLTLGESALLAGLPESPTAYSPFGSHPEFAKRRQVEVLSTMKSLGYITASEEKKALNEPLKYQNFANKIKAPHFSLYIRDLLIKKYGAHLVEEGGLKVKTTLDLKIQDFAQDAVATEVARLRGLRVSNGAAIVTDPGKGEILAMVGSKDYFDETIDGNVNVTLAHRQPGSSIKPINYAVGLMGVYNAATLFVDKETCFAAFCPKNYDGKFHGAVLMRSALANSFNIPAVKMLKLNGVENMMATASAMGITTFTDASRYGLSLTLGGGEVSMLDMSTAFGVFANRGYRVDLNPILEIKDSGGKIIEKKKEEGLVFGKRIIPEEVTYIISHILSDNQARAEAFGTNSALRVGNQTVSVKTGTTNDLKDNWTIGYTQNFLTTVWVGNNDNTPMSGVASGITGAAPIWNKIMANVLKDKKTDLPPRPKNVVGMNICATSGLLPPATGDNKCETKFELFIRGKTPSKTDPGKQKVWIDKETNDLPKQGKTDNLELRDEYVVEDGTGDKYCITCPHPTPSPSPTPTPR